MQKDIKPILEKVESGTYNEEEERIAKLWLFQLRSKDLDQISEAELEDTSEQIWNRLQPDAATPVRRFKGWQRIGAVAAAILVIAFGFYFYYDKEQLGLESASGLVQDVAPGAQGATLTLADGKKVRLSDALSGTIAEESGVSITKSADGQLIYALKGNGADVNKENTLSISNGETYQLCLPDGTRVWLNTKSSLTYAPKLVQAGQRRVKLVGEAYFEVAKDRSKPFIVRTGTQQVEVMGTSFNVNAYLDEPVTSTTLVEGSIKIKTEKGEHLVRPGEQAINTGKDIRIVRTETENITDWKDGDFYLNHVDFKVAMRKIARWYDVDIVYDGSVPEGLESGGWISRDKPLSQVLKSIESSSMVRFRIEGRTIHVIR